MIKFNDPNLSEFLKHSKNYISASVFIKGLSVISIPIVTYLLTPEEYGKVGVFTSLTSILVILLSLNMFVSIIRFYHENEIKIFDLIWTIVIFQIPFLIFFTFLIFRLFKDLLLEKLNINQDIFFGSLISASLFIFTRHLLAYLQTSQKSNLYNKISSFRGLLLLILTLSLYYFLRDDKYLGRIYAEILINIAGFIFFIIFLIKTSRINFSKLFLRNSLLYSVPLIPHALAAVFLNSSDRIILNQLRGPIETGYYTFAYHIGLILEIIIIGMNKSWVPMFFKRIKEKKYIEIERLSLNYKKIIFIIAVVIILYAQDVVILVASKDFHSSLNVIPIIVIGYCFMFVYTIYVNYSLFRKKTLLVAINTIIAGLLNIFLNYTYIPDYGYMAAGISTLISFFILMILHYLSTRYILSLQTVRMIKLLDGIYWVFGAYGIVLICDLFLDNQFIIHLIKLTYLILVFILLFPKLRGLIKIR